MKVTDLETLALRVREHQRAGRKVVHCHGEFNLVHEGHLRWLENARAMGDVLVVTVASDRDLSRAEPGSAAATRPRIPQRLRAEWVGALTMVDHVAVHDGSTASEAIRRVKSDIYASPTSGQGREAAAARDAANAVGGKAQFTDAGLEAAVAEQLPLSPEAYDYLASLRPRYPARAIQDHLDRLSDLRVLAIGEAILDEYVYCDALGKSGKEPVLAMRYLTRDMFAGGVLAICNHLAEFCRHVELLTYLGTTHTHEGFVRGHLKTGIDPSFVYKQGSPTVVKRRYIESYSLAKLFGVYRINDQLLAGREEEEICQRLEARLPEADVVIVADYGHGLITPRVAQKLVEGSRFLAVNTQLNAANVSFHTISKYRSADYVCIQEGELRHESRSREGSLQQLVSALAQQLSCRAVMITRGKYGSLLYQGKEFIECPAFALKIVDRIGAGDALMALTSLCVGADLPAEVTSLLGNLAGAEAVATIGNESSIERASLEKRLRRLLD